jgi:hypothetical protein
MRKKPEHFFKKTFCIGDDENLSDELRQHWM